MIGEKRAAGWTDPAARELLCAAVVEGCGAVCVAVFAPDPTMRVVVAAFLALAAGWNARGAAERVYRR